MKLDEILNKVLSYEITEKTEDFFQAEFESNDRVISFYFDRESDYYEDDVNSDNWQCEFAERKAGGKTSHNVTGSGGEFEVFATLKAILKEFFWKYKPKVLKFDASKAEGSRADLYQKLFSKGLPAGYKLARDDEGGRFDVKFKVVKTE